MSKMRADLSTDLMLIFAEAPLPWRKNKRHYTPWPKCYTPNTWNM